MRNHLKELGRKLQVECPDNDCRVFLNVFEMLEGVEDDLVGCTLSEWGKKVLQMERQRLEHELEGMFYTNYAIRQFRNRK